MITRDRARGVSFGGIFSFQDDTTGLSHLFTVLLFTPAYLDTERRLQDVMQYTNSKAGVVVHLDVMQNDVIWIR
jgi:hypothetical protein